MPAGGSMTRVETSAARPSTSPMFCALVLPPAAAIATPCRTAARQYKVARNPGALAHAGHHRRRRGRARRGAGRGQPAPRRLRRAARDGLRRAGAALPAPAALQEVPRRRTRGGAPADPAGELLRKHPLRADARKSRGRDRRKGTQAQALGRRQPRLRQARARDRRARAPVAGSRRRSARRARAADD